MYVCVCVHIYIYIYIYIYICCCVVQLLRRVWLFATPWTAARQASLSITNSQSLLRLMSIMSLMPSNHLILCCPPLLLPSIFPNIRIFSNRLDLPIRGPSIGASASASVLPVNIQGWFPLGWTGWISLLSKGLPSIFCSTTNLQASVLQHLAFFMSLCVCQCVCVCVCVHTLSSWYACIHTYVCVCVCVCVCSWFTYITFRKWLLLFLRNKCNNQLIFWKYYCD